MKALVLDNKIIEICEKQFPVANGMRWINCTIDTSVGDSVDGDNVVVPSPTTISLQQEKEQKLYELANYRYAWETGGFNFFGQRIATDDRSKNLITGARIAADLDSNYSVNWKTKTGWMTLNSTQIIAISDAVRDFVQNCFNTERYHFERIVLLNTAQEINSYDFTTGWP